MVNPILTINITFMTLITGALILRLYSRLTFNHKLEKDDIAAAIGTAGALSLSAVSLDMLRYGYGDHLWKGPASTVVTRAEQIMKELLVCTILHTFSLTMAKTSIIILYNRIFEMHIWFRRCMSAALIVSWVMFILMVFITIFQCRPTDAAWNFEVMRQAHPSCINFQAFLYSTTSINIFVDLMLVFLPIIPIARLNLQPKKKLTVCLLFLVGFFSCVASVVRLVSLRTLKDTDMFFSTCISLFWSVIETDVALICASCPAIRTIFTRNSRASASKFLCSGSRDGGVSNPSHKNIQNSDVEKAGLMVGNSGKAGRWITPTDSNISLNSQSQETHFQNIDLQLGPLDKTHEQPEISTGENDPVNVDTLVRNANQTESVKLDDGVLGQST
ncbi:hypothetical protein H072_4287 [Dactylellina haptotyla CBS 200.50]|uniref:Rhodopsin domain-containing protein n=1 Tax=Dactylellina haptotyla (strain CBS 200.50) TaxID=1284197 RepID=S8C2A4_DACHA|nr:hypothetical protein H072_4287 [Dactylellina haptotyla CBS 200.50]